MVSNKEWKELGSWCLFFTIMCAYVVLLNSVGLFGLSPSASALSFFAKLFFGKDDGQYDAFGIIMDVFLIKAVSIWIEARYVQLFTWIQRTYKSSVPISTEPNNQTEDVSQYLKWSLEAMSTVFMFALNSYRLYKTTFSINVVWVAFSMLFSSVGGYLILGLTALQKYIYNCKEHFRTQSRAASSQTKNLQNQFEILNIDATQFGSARVYRSSSQFVSRALNHEESKNQSANFGEFLKSAKLLVIAMCDTGREGLLFQSLSPLIELLLHPRDCIHFFSRFIALYPWGILSKIFSLVLSAFGFKGKNKKMSTPLEATSQIGLIQSPVERRGRTESISAVNDRSLTPSQASRPHSIWSFINAPKGGGSTKQLISEHSDQVGPKVILKYTDLKDTSWRIALSGWFKYDSDKEIRVRDIVLNPEFIRTCNEIFQNCTSVGCLTIDYRFSTFHDFLIHYYDQNSNADCQGLSANDDGVDTWCFKNQSERKFFFFGLSIPLLVACKMNKVRYLFVDDDPLSQWAGCRIAFRNRSSMTFLDFCNNLLCSIDGLKVRAVSAELSPLQLDNAFIESPLELPISPGSANQIRRVRTESRLFNGDSNSCSLTSGSLGNSQPKDCSLSPPVYGSHS